MTKIQKNRKTDQNKKFNKPSIQKKIDPNIHSTKKEPGAPKVHRARSKANEPFLKKKTKAWPLTTKKPTAIIHFFKTETNAISTLTDMSGNPKAWVSAGSLGIKGSRKSTVYASEAVAKALGEKTLSLGFNKILVKVRGIGFAKTKAIKILKKEGLQITHLYDVTPTPHNGCRLPRKQRK